MKLKKNKFIWRMWQASTTVTTCRHLNRTRQITLAVNPPRRRRRRRRGDFARIHAENLKLSVGAFWSAIVIHRGRLTWKSG